MNRSVQYIFTVFLKYFKLYIISKCLETGVQDYEWFTTNAQKAKKVNYGKKGKKKSEKLIQQ